MKNKVQRMSLIWALLILLFISLWYVYNLDRGTFRYHYHKKLFHPNNKTWLKPVDLFNITSSMHKPDDYIEATNSIDRLFDLIKTSNVLIPLNLDQEYHSKQVAIEAGKPVSNSTKCRDQLGWIKEQIVEHPDYFLLKGKLGQELTDFMDAFGRPEAGLFSHAADSWLGTYDYCQAASLKNNEIRGRYCVAKFRFSTWPSSPTLYEPEPGIRVGLCLPETCDSLAVEVHNETIDWLAKQQMNDVLKNQLQLHSLFCLPDERSPLRQLKFGTRIFLFVIGSWLALICTLSFLYELLWRRGLKEKKKKSSLMRLINGFTLRNSIKSFTLCRPTAEDARVSLVPLDFVKFMMALAVVLSHALIFCNYYVRTKQSFVELGRSDLAKLVMSFGRCVDTFLTVFGLVMSYTLLQKFDVRKLSNPFIWVSSNIAIFLRLMPIHALIIAFNKLVTPHLGRGAWWDYGVDRNSVRQFCTNSTWLDLIPFAANLGEHVAPPCNPPSWFLGPYSQIAALIPLIIYVIGTLPSHWLRFLFVVLIASISSSDVATRIYNQKVVLGDSIGEYGAFLVAVVEKYESTGYMDTLGRLGSVIIGAYTGYLLHLYQVGEISKWPRWFASKLFNLIIICIHIALFLVPMLAHRLSPADNGSSLTMLQFAFINFLMIPFWPLINCLLIIAATTTYNRHVAVRFMSHPLWSAANKLGLGIYLIHYEVLITTIGFYSDGPTYGTNFEVLRLASFAICVTTLIAIAVYLFFEAPMAYMVSKFIIPGIQSFASGRGGVNRGHKVQDEINYYIDPRLVGMLQANSELEQQKAATGNNKRNFGFLPSGQNGFIRAIDPTDCDEEVRKILDASSEAKQLEYQDKSSDVKRSLLTKLVLPDSSYIIPMQDQQHAQQKPQQDTRRASKEAEMNEIRRNQSGTETKDCDD